MEIKITKRNRKSYEKEHGIVFLDPYNPAKEKPKGFIEKIRRWHLEKYHQSSILLINMELSNGFHRSFLVRQKEGSFRYKKRTYILDDECKYWNMDAALYALDYHEEFVLPLRRKFPVQTVKRIMETQGISEVEYATNPSVLERFMTTKIAEGIMKGQQLDDFFRQIRLLLIIAVIAAIVHLLLFMQKSGMFQQIKLPF